MVIAAIILAILGGAIFVMILTRRSSIPLASVLFALLSRREPPEKPLEKRDTGLIVGALIGMTSIMISIQLFLGSQILDAIRDLSP